MSLQDAIHQLTRPHWSLVDGALVEKPPLLAELRAACVSTHGNHGGGGGQGVGLAVNSKAIEVETRIREDALAEQFERTGIEYQGGLVDLIQSWSGIDGEWEAYLGKITDEWITDIQAALIQRRPPWRPTLNCPACGQRFHGNEREPNLWVEYWDHDEEKMNHPSQWSAGCDGCGAEWVGKEIDWLRAATDTPAKDVAEVAQVS